MATLLTGRVERAIKHDFVVAKGKWTRQTVRIVMDSTPFSEGALRMAFRLQQVNDDGTRVNMVAKISKDMHESKETYFRDVQSQAVAGWWAGKFNERKVPKKIEFISCSVLELAERPGRPLAGMEPFVEGVFEKHNSNVGGAGGNERYTPNAFSHFTWEASGHTILVCDIQGVSDQYTDPQILTANGAGFGRGNLGMNGIQAFMMRHKCNKICHMLGISNEGSGQVDSSGARPGTSNTGSNPSTPLKESEVKQLAKMAGLSIDVDAGLPVTVDGLEDGDSPLSLPGNSPAAGFTPPPVARGDSMRHRAAANSTDDVFSDFDLPSSAGKKPSTTGADLALDAADEQIMDAILSDI